MIPYISDREYKRRASILKKMGLVNFDLSKRLSPAQKGVITKLTIRHTESVWKEGVERKINKPPLKALIENPDLFKSRKVSKKQAKAWKQAGYKVINGRVIVRGEEGAVIKVYPTRIRLERIEIIEDIYTFASEDFFNISKKLFNRKLEKGEYITGRFGNHGIFKTQFVNYEDFYRYVSDVTDGFSSEITPTLQIVHHYRKNKDE